MASNETSTAAALATASTKHSEPVSIPHEQIQRQTDALPSSTPVEMSQLQSQSQYASRLDGAIPASSAALSSHPLQGEQETIQRPAAAHLPNASSPQRSLSEDAPQSAAIVVGALSSTRPTNRARQDSTAIGPDSESPIVVSDPSPGPAVLITLLLTTGARHPYKIDEKYLKRRNVSTTSNNVDPFSISVYTMKELVWRDWREEWEPRPTSPAAIRLIHFGKLLDDKQLLRDCRFNPTQPNVVHMTVKPQEVVDDEENAKTGKSASGRDRDGGERSVGCRCVIL